MMRDTKSIEEAIEKAKKNYELGGPTASRSLMELNVTMAELLLDIREILRMKDNVGKWGSQL